MIEPVARIDHADTGMNGPWIDSEAAGADRGTEAVKTDVPHGERLREAPTASQGHIPKSTDYTADAIRVLSEDEIAERFVFVRAARLVERYPHVPPEFITRLLTACEHSGCPEALAVRRYLDEDRTVQIPDALREAHRAILAEEREQRERQFTPQRRHQRQERRR